MVVAHEILENVGRNHLEEWSRRRERKRPRPLCQTWSVQGSRCLPRGGVRREKEGSSRPDSFCLDVSRAWTVMDSLRRGPLC